MLLKYSHKLRIIQNQMRFVKGKWLSVIYIPKKNYFRETTNLFTMQIIIPVLLICPLQINKICMCWVCLEDTWLCYQSYIIQLLGDRCVLVNLTKKMHAFKLQVAHFTICTSERLPGHKLYPEKSFLLFHVFLFVFV